MANATNNESAKFLVVLQPGSVAAELFKTDIDSKVSGMPTLTCSAVSIADTAFAVVRRIPRKSNPDGSRRSHQTWWLRTVDIAAVFQFDGPGEPVGFLAD
jgi:hypothetical protein